LTARGAHDGAAAGANGLALRQIAQFGQAFVELLLHGVIASCQAMRQRHGQIHRIDGDLFQFIGAYHAVAARHVCHFMRAPQIDRRAGQALQGDGQVFGEMRKAGAFLQRLYEAGILAHRPAMIVQRRQHGQQAVIQARHAGGGQMLQFTQIEYRQYAWLRGVQVRAAQHALFDDIHVSMFLGQIIDKVGQFTIAAEAGAGRQQV